MKKFLKPTWIIFVILFILNIPLYFLAAIQDWLSLWYANILQWLWLYALFGEIGFDVTSSYIWPNFLGWTLIILGSLITLIIYYVIASVISKYYNRQENSGSWLEFEANQTLKGDEEVNEVFKDNGDWPHYPNFTSPGLSYGKKLTNSQASEAIISKQSQFVGARSKIVRNLNRLTAASFAFRVKSCSAGTIGSSFLI